MTPPISDARLKFQWAEAGIEKLRDALAAFDNTYPPVPTIEPDPDTSGGRLYRCGPVPVPPVHMALILGDIVHSLRSALDCAVYTISARVDPDFHSEFPIYIDPVPNPRAGISRGFDPDGLRRIKHLPDPAQELIRGNQPYNRHPTRPTRDRLWLLQDLSNIDKHRAIPVVTGVVKAAGVSVVSKEGTDEPQPRLDFLGPGLKEGDPILRLPPVSEAYPHFQPHIATDVLLGVEGEFFHQRLIFVAVWMRDAVERAIRDLEPSP